MSNISHKKIFVVSSSLWKMLKISFSSKIHHQEVTLGDLLTIYYPSSAAQDIFNRFYLETATKNSLRHGSGCPCTLVLREGNPWISPSKHNFPGVTEPGNPLSHEGKVPLVRFCCSASPSGASHTQGHSQDGEQHSCHGSCGD